MIASIFLPIFLLASSLTVVDNGVTVDVAVQRAGTSSAARAGEDADVTLRVRDASGAPLKNLGINAWFVPHRAGTPPLPRKECVARVGTFTAGSLFHQPAVDLNVYHVVTLNDDATLTVVDPRFGFGGTHLLAIVELEAPGEDWSFHEAKQELFVTMPAAGKVAVVDTRTWKVAQNIEVGANATRIERQPDGGYLWVTYDGGVAAIDPLKKSVAARIATDAGPHDLALSHDNRYAFITNAAAGNTSVIDVQTLKSLRRVPTGTRPMSVAWSPLAQAAFVVSESDGGVFAVDPKRSAPRAKDTAEAGLNRIRFAPNGRLAFVTNPQHDVVHIVDATTAKVIQTADVEDGPFEVSFSETIAYVRHLRSETVLMITLANVGKAGAPVHIADFPGGQHAFGVKSRPSPFPGIIVSPGQGAVLVTNPADGEVYFYKEGMAAPMGRFSAYRHTPRAAIVIDRSLREVKPAVYATLARMPQRAGTYDVALLIDQPRVIACAQVTIAPQ
ncbi:MAG TPA: YncE family protein [Thermoanaerobaculia bacterium]|nr:YncE family protein [Thermoanaerobaculia bacterium]